MVTLLPLVAIVPVSVPLSVPPPVALLSVIVVLLDGLFGLPLASCDCTVTLNAVPAVPVLGTVVNTSLLAVILNALLTADVRPVLAAVRFFDPTRLMLRSLNVARPEELVGWVSVPLSVPDPV